MTVRKSDFKLIANYLHRFVEGPVFSRQKFAALFRYAGSFCSLVWEKINGLDYTMVYYTKDESVHNSVYTKAPKKVLKRVFCDISDIPGKGFIDVGCGKGYVVSRAAREPFQKVGGIEYSKNLYDICLKNLKKKKISDRHVYNCDAKDFAHYGEFDIFFFNNPFDETILGPVAQKIYDTHKGRKCYLYFLNPHLKPRTDAIENAGFKLVKSINDKNEWYFNINVYSNC